MACFSPLKGWRSRKVGKTGKRGIVFTAKDGYQDRPMEVPCGHCIGCRQERARQWAVRIMHEASLWEDNCFVTLTYNDQNLPNDGSLNKKHFQDFMKRVREKFTYTDSNGDTYRQTIRYFHCGEYGEENRRPHYHACLFNVDFSDKVVYSEKAGNQLYYSETLERLWTHGFCTLGAVTYESAAYCARYVMKKVMGPSAKEHYLSLNTVTGVLSEILPEYVTMSRRPGIAAGWYAQFGKEVFPSDFIIIGGKKHKPPRFYDKALEESDPKALEAIKILRQKNALLRADDNTPERLEVREKVAAQQIAALKRNV